MTTIAKRLVLGSALTGTAAVYYTAPNNTKAVIKSAALVNTTAAAIAGTVHVVPVAGAPGAANTLISARNIAAGETYTCPELVNQVLTAGETLQALGNGLTLVVSGAEIV